MRLNRLRRDMAAAATAYTYARELAKTLPIDDDLLAAYHRLLGHHPQCPSYTAICALCTLIYQDIGLDIFDT